MFNDKENIRIMKKEHKLSTKCVKNMHNTNLQQYVHNMQTLPITNLCLFRTIILTKIYHHHHHHYKRKHKY